MAGRKTFILLAAIMVALCVVSVGITIPILYRQELDNNRARLRVSTANQARLIEAIARYDKHWNTEYPGGFEAATLSQIADAHQNYAHFGKTGEFTLARREGDQIVFLLRHRHSVVEQPNRVSFDSELAEPMRRALSGASGSVVGQDYRGVRVLAGYEPVAELGWGIVAKIDLSELHAPLYTGQPDCDRFDRSADSGRCISIPARKYSPA